MCLREDDDDAFVRYVNLLRDDAMQTLTELGDTVKSRELFVRNFGPIDGREFLFGRAVTTQPVPRSAHICPDLRAMS